MKINLCIVKYTEMKYSNLIKMYIKNNIVLVKLFPKCIYDGTSLLSNDTIMFGEPFIMGNRGENKDEIHVLMYWSSYNIRPVGEVIGHIKNNELFLYKESLLNEVNDIDLCKIYTNNVTH